MKRTLVALLIACCLFCVSGLAQSTRPGVLLMAHGGSLAWNEEVRHVADEADLQVPTEVAFGMATRSTLQAAIDRLAARHVTEIIAVPLFISSHSSVIESQAYLLGQRAAMPEDLKEFAMMDHDMGGGMGEKMQPSAMADALKPIHAPVPLRMASALDANPSVAAILSDRAASISHDPSHEVVLLVAHGPVPEDDNRLWLKDMHALAAQMGQHTHYAAIDCLTLRDDADDPVRNAATAELRKRVEQVTAQGKSVLIVPLLLSYGGIEGGLRKRLDGLSYRMPTQGLLPDARMAAWVVNAAQTQK